MSKIRTPYDHDRLTLALAPVDQAFRASEDKWGVARLERLVSASTLASYRRGWLTYREAIDDGDAAAIEAVGPKMIAALAFMDSEATALGHAPLSVEAWEATLSDGTVLALVRTMPEAHALVRDAVGRQRLVYTLEEVARIIEQYETVNAVKLAFPGAEVKRASTTGERVQSGVQTSSGELSDWARSDPIGEVIR